MNNVPASEAPRSRPASGQCSSTYFTNPGQAPQGPSTASFQHWHLGAEPSFTPNPQYTAQLPQGSQWSSNLPTTFVPNQPAPVAGYPQSPTAHTVLWPPQLSPSLHMHPTSPMYQTHASQQYLQGPFSQQQAVPRPTSAAPAPTQRPSSGVAPGTSPHVPQPVTRYIRRPMLQTVRLARQEAQNNAVPFSGPPNPQGGSIQTNALPTPQNVMATQQPMPHSISLARNGTQRPVVPNNESFNPQGGNVQTSSPVNMNFPHPTVTKEGTEHSLLNEALYPPIGYTPRPAPYPGPGRVLYQMHLAEGFDMQGRDSKYLSFIAGFAMPPISIRPEFRLMNGSFKVSEVEYKRLLATDRSVHQPLRLWEFNDQKCTGYRVRCVKLANSLPVREEVWCLAPTSWPGLISVKVNDAYIELRRKYHWDVELPANVTFYIRPGINRVRIASMKTVNEKETWSVAVEKLMVKSVSQVRQLVEQQQESIKSTQERIRNRLAGSDPDVEILSESLTVQVTDPMESTLIEHPVRSRNCTHLECFDLHNYLMSRPGNPCSSTSWKCPLCGRDARPQTLLTSLWMKDVLSSLRASASKARAILVNKDGDWRVKEEETSAKPSERDEARKAERSTRDSGSEAVTYIEID